MRLARGR